MRRTIIIWAALVVAVWNMAGCSAPKGNRSALDPATGARVAGLQVPIDVQPGRVLASTDVPQTGLVLTDGTETAPASLSLTKPSSTSTLWLAETDEWADLAGVLTLAKMTSEQFNKDGAVTSRRVIEGLTVDNAKILTESAALIAEVKKGQTALSADQLAGYKAAAEEFGATVRAITPTLADVVMKILLPVP